MPGDYKYTLWEVTAGLGSKWAEPTISLPTNDSTTVRPNTGNSLYNSVSKRLPRQQPVQRERNN